jgi:hypothetical protein
MGEIRTVTTLRRKRDEISASIRLYERQLAQARADLAHITAAVRVFEASGDPGDIARYVDTFRLFKRGEPWAICREALRKGPLTTDARLIAFAKLIDGFMQSKKFDRPMFLMTRLYLRQTFDGWNHWGLVLLPSVSSRTAYQSIQQNKPLMLSVRHAILPKPPDAEDGTTWGCFKREVRAYRRHPR